MASPSRDRITALPEMLHPAGRGRRGASSGPGRSRQPPAPPSRLLAVRGGGVPSRLGSGGAAASGASGGSSWRPRRQPRLQGGREVAGLLRGAAVGRRPRRSRAGRPAGRLSRRCGDRLACRVRCGSPRRGASPAACCPASAAAGRRWRRRAGPCRRDWAGRDRAGRDRAGRDRCWAAGWRWPGGRRSPGWAVPDGGVASGAARPRCAAGCGGRAGVVPGGPCPGWPWAGVAVVRRWRRCSRAGSRLPG